MNHLVSKYRKLLIAEETPGAVEEVLSLIRSALGGEIESTGTSLRIDLRGKVTVAGIKEWAVQLYNALNLDNASKAAKTRRRTARNKRYESLALHSSLYLALTPFITTHASPGLSENKYSLLFDSCLLLFHHAYFGLLPKLEDDWSVERKMLLTSFKLLAEQLPRAADRFNVLALTFDAEENSNVAAEYYCEVVRATSSDEHDFMTCLQSAWSYLIELRRFTEAHEMLIESMPRVTNADQNEFRELLRQTLRLYAREHGATRSSNPAASPNRKRVVALD